ncbi:PKD domain-containing protein [uncultured Draconibacterium sp.]|uniref:PKD domain-containing protein n=1 Tax=uncultured Draconibacterium sp. TaxID=1573823 RepID=UPI0029C999FC|nr:PKD domain-containing protein [uncultured Draconibacterium sp.]
MKNRFKILMFLAVLAFAFTACDDDDPANVAAGFTYAPEENIQAGDTVFFTNTSVEAAGYEWSFGDSETSTEANPFHIYSEPGIYDVTLIAVNDGVSNTVTHQVNVDADLGYIINYGSYNGDKSTITAYNRYADEVINEFYTSANGVSMVANVQYAYLYEGKIYLMENNADGVSWVDASTFEQTMNTISEGIIKPRYCIGYGDYLYVSCYGGDAWADSSLGYIAKINLATSEVEKIAMPGGPEGLEIIDGKLYAALRYGEQIAEMDLSTESITYFDVAGQPIFFEKDPQNNLYVTISRNYNDYETQVGMGYFNTQTNTMDAVYPLDGIGNTYDNVIDANSDFSKLYVSYTTSTNYDTYISTGSIAVFDVATKQFESENLVDGIEGINGLQVFEDDIISYVSPSATISGTAVFYSKNGEKVAEYSTGISPILMVKSK